ncbi:MAG: FHA domain-containing protein [Clostridiales bacterium]|nr:FHA domain-containing protein [Clostridiales bacterium]
MNGINVESNGTNTYLVYKLSENEEIDTLSLGMMVNNKISNVIPILFTQIDSDRYFKYNISSKISLKQYFSGVVNKKRLLTVFSTILKAIIKSTEYMIDASSFILDPEYIYVDVSSGEAYLLCMPLMELADKRVELSAFFKSIMFSTQFDQSENVDYVAMLISYINSNPTISPEGFEEFINGLLNGPKPAKKEEKPAPRPVAAPQAPVADSAQQTAASSGIKTPLTKDQMPQSLNNNAKAQPPMQNKPVNNAPVNNNLLSDRKNQAPLKNDRQNKNVQGNQTGFAVPGKPAGVSQPVPAEKPKKEKKGGFSLFGKKKEKKPEQNNKSQNTANNNTGFNVPGQNVQVTSTNVSIPNMPVNNPSVPNQSGAKMNFGDTTVLGGNAPIGETTVLGVGAPAAPRQAFLVRKKNNERIIINKDMFKLGKERSYVDYCVSDNSAVSRSHANIIKKGEEYFVVDMNSTNHSFINGMILTPQTESKINNGDTLSLGDEEFVFHI